jgi:hypothetical protein
MTIRYDGGVSSPLLKKAVTVPRETWQAATHFAPDGNMSAYVASALADRVRLDTQREMAAHLAAEHGQPTPSEVEHWATALGEPIDARPQ